MNRLATTLLIALTVSLHADPQPFLDDALTKAINERVAAVLAAAAPAEPIVSTAGELNAALEKGGSIKLKANVTVTSYPHVKVNGTRLQGIAADAGITIDSATANHALFITASDIVISDLALTSKQGIGPGAVEHRAIAIGRPSARVTIQRCHIHDIPCGIRMDGGPASQFVEGITITDNTIGPFSYSGVLLNWNMRDVRLSGNRIFGRAAGEKHTVNHNCVWIGNGTERVTITGDTYRETDRWCAELFYCNASSVTGCLVEHANCGISMGGGAHSVCSSNILRGVIGGAGCIELVGPDCTAIGNIIEPDGMETLCGIAVNADYGDAATPHTRATVTGNRISGAFFGIQVYSNTWKPCGVVESLFSGNTIETVKRNGQSGRGIFFNSDGKNPLSRNVVGGNVFHGVFDGAIYLFNAPKTVARNNTQYAPLLPGETPRKNNMVCSNHSTFTTDDLGFFQSADGFANIGTNVRVVP